jgi:hypothetical protein
MRKDTLLEIQFLIIFLSALSFSSLYGQNAIQNKLISLEKERFAAMTKKDTFFLKKVLADDLIYIHSNALSETKNDFLHSISTGKIVYKAMNSEEIRVRIFEKTAILNGTVHVMGSLNGKDFDIHLLYTDVYHKNKQNWQLVAWQSVKKN